jgi:hypothetical protein
VVKSFFSSAPLLYWQSGAVPKGLEYGVMGVEEYLKNFGRHPRVLEQIRREAKQKGPVSMRAINLEIKRYRRELRRKDA